MIPQEQYVESLIDSALIQGEVNSPQLLLQALGQLSSPVSVLTSEEPSAEIFEIFRKEFPALNWFRRGVSPLSANEEKQAVGLLRWILRELSAWTRDRDPRLVKLTAVMVALNAFHWREPQWALLSGNAVNHEMIRQLSCMLSNYSWSIDGDLGRHASKTNEFLVSLANADSEGDWGWISANWQQIETWLHEGLFLQLAAPCLAHFDMSGLAIAVGEVSKVQTAYLVARSLSETNRLKLARATTSHRYRFAAVLSIAWGDQKFTELSFEAENEFTALLSEVCSDTDQWHRWMQAFNEYPTRFPALQSPLGKALSQAPEHALRSYVDSIRLYPWPLVGLSNSQPNGRESVALCLTTFRKAALFTQRCRLWNLTHKRWSFWNFGIQDSSKRHLLGVVGSELDYGITAHAAECLTSKERISLHASLTNEIRDIEMRWHRSLSHLRSQRNALLSSMQPLLAASDADWLFTHPIIPSELSQNSYTQQKFG